MTLKMRSRSPKSNQLALKLVTMIYQCKLEENPSIHWFKRYSTYRTLTLKMRPARKLVTTICKSEENPLV